MPVDVSILEGADEDHHEGTLCRIVVDRLPVCVYVLDQEGRFIYANAAFYHLLRRAAGSLSGRPIAEIVHLEDAAKLEWHLRERRRGDRATNGLEVRLSVAIPAFGTTPAVRFARIQAEGIYRGEQFLGTCGILQDVTGERQRWDDLEASEEGHRRLLDSAPAAIAVEQAGRIAYVNPAGAALLGVSTPGAAVGLDVLSVIAPSHRDVISDLLARQSDDDEHGWFETRIQCPDGRLVEAEYIYRAVRYKDAPAAEILVVDATERRQAEREREEARSSILRHRITSLRIDRRLALGRMATRWAHVLNQPLQGVRGLAEHLLLAMDRGWSLSPHDYRHKLELIMAQADRLDRTIQHIRENAGMEGYHQRRLVDPNEVLRQAGEFGGPGLAVRGIRLELCLAEALPMIKADPSALEEAVMYLLDNARDAIEACRASRTVSGSQVVVLTSSLQEKQGAQWVAIAVTDCGIGVPKELQERVFEPFFSTREHDGGTGLGLSAVKAIAEESGGQVVLESEPGVGTTVRLLLPVLPQPTC